MKRIALYICSLLTAMASLTAEAQVMTVHHKDGTTETFPVAQIEEVTFDSQELPKLQNQFAYGNETTAVGSVVMMSDEDGYQFALYAQEGMTSFGDSPLLAVALPQELLGKTIDLATADPDEVMLMVQNKLQEQLTGTLKVSFDKFGKKVTVALEAQTAMGYALRAAYTGAFATTYDADNAFAVTPQEGEMAEYDIAAVLRMKPATTGAATHIAFGDVQATTAEGLKAGHAAVWFSVSAAKLNTTLDLAADKSSYTFKYIDYATGLTQENTVVSGTLTTVGAEADKVYFALTAQLEDGTLVEGDYYGPVQDVESLEEMVPNPVLPNKFTYYDADGSELVDQEVVQVKEKLTKEGYHVLYFMPDGAGQTDKQATPQLQFSDKLLNAGKIELANLQDGDGFSVTFKGMQLTSPDAKYYGFSNVPNNGTLTLTKDDEGNYDIYLEVTNKYNTPGMGQTNVGDGTKLVLSFKGQTVQE